MAGTLRERFRDVRVPLVVDFSAVTYLDAATLTELVVLAKRVLPDRVTLAGLAPHLRRLFAITALEAVFDFR